MIVLEAGKITYEDPIYEFLKEFWGPLLNFFFRGLIKLELAKYYKDSEMTAFISERSRNSK